MPGAARDAPRVTLPVFVIHFEAPDWLGSSVRSLLQSDIAVDLTVVNNGPQRSLALPAEVSVIDSRRNVGYAGGANLAIRSWLAGPEPFCVVGSHDLHVDRSTLGRLLEVAEAHSRLGIVAPNVGRPKGAPIGTLADGVQLRPWASGTCLLLRRTCICEVGGFDEDFGSYVEDRELGMRVNAAGWNVGWVPDAVAHGLGSSAPDTRRLIAANHIVLTWKQHGTWPAGLRCVKTVWAALRTLRSDARTSAQLILATVDGTRKVWRLRRHGSASTAIQDAGSSPPTSE